MVIDDNNKFIFIAIARTGSTTVKEHFEGIEPLAEPPEIYHATIEDVLTQYPDKKNYFKWAYVRNPWDRMVSAYYEFKNHYSNMDAPGAWAKEVGEHKTFDEFIFNFHNLEVSRDVHFIPQVDCLSINGNVNMDFICRYERYQDSFNDVCDKLKIKAKTLGRWRQTAGTTRDKDYTVHYTHQHMIDIVGQVYIKDVDYFNYKFK